MLPIARALGCQPGSAAVVLLGGHPLTGGEVGLLDQLGDEINGTRMDLATLGDRLDRLHMAHRRLVAEFRADEALLHDFDDWLIFHERDRSPGSLRRCASSNAGPVMS
jgi:hypothetical protein